jgi:hypothetical protein
MPTSTSAATWVNWNMSSHMVQKMNAVIEGMVDTSATSSLAQTTIKIWASWNQDYTTASLTGNDATTTVVSTTTGNTIIVDPWPAWNRTYTITSPWTNPGHVGARRVQSPEELVAQEQRRVAYREEQVRAEGERALARERAQRMLRENLTEEQREELAANGHFTLAVLDRDSGERRLYRIRKGRSRNVQRVDDSGRVLKTLCAHPAILCPDEDTMLAQKLWLQNQEQEFLRIANHS